MKKIFNYALCVATALLAASACTQKVEDAFELTSSERLDAFSQNVVNVLQSAPNGWQAHYYASRTYGGYNVFCKFENGDSVTIASEKVGDTQYAGLDETGKLITNKSHYKMEQSMGCILSFDSYNTVFHYFSEPKSDLGDAGDGMAGDFEFRVKSCCSDSVVLEGKKHQSKVVMYPVPENTTWQEQYEAVKTTEKEMSARTYYLWKDNIDQQITVTTSYRRLVFTYLDEDSIETREAVPFIITKEGYKFYNTIEVKDMVMSGFNIGEDGIYLASNDASIRLEAQTLPLYEQFIGSMWFIKYDNLGEYAQPYWDTFHTALEKAGANETKATLYWALLGKYNSKVGFHMNAGGDQATIGFTVSKVDEEGNRMKLKYNATDCNKAGTNFYDKYKLKEALRPFIGGTKISTRTFNLEVDDARKPTYMILIDVSEPKNVIKLLAEEVMYPFGDEPED